MAHNDKANAKMRFISRIFLRGLLVLLPLILTLYPLYYFFQWTDTVARELQELLIPGVSYIPGTGLVMGIATICLLGLLMSSRLVRYLYGLLETSIKSIPLVKSLYTAIRSLLRYLAPSEDGKSQDVVIVRVPDTAVEIIGFVVRSDLTGLPEQLDKDGKVAVYIPMSYQVGGFTLFLPEQWLAPTDMAVEEAMKNVLTGWMTGESGTG